MKKFVLYSWDHLHGVGCVGLINFEQAERLWQHYNELSEALRFPNFSVVANTGSSFDDPTLGGILPIEPGDKFVYEDEDGEISTRRSVSRNEPEEKYCRIDNINLTDDEVDSLCDI